MKYDTQGFAFMVLLLVGAIVVVGGVAYYISQNKAPMQTPLEQAKVVDTQNETALAPSAGAPVITPMETSITVVLEKSVGTTEVAETFIGNSPDYSIELATLHPENYSGLAQKTLDELTEYKKEHPGSNRKVLTIGTTKIEIELISAHEEEPTYSHQVCLPDKSKCFTADSYSLLSINGTTIELADEDIKEIKFSNGLILYIAAASDSEFSDPIFADGGPDCNGPCKVFFSESQIYIKKK